MTQVQVWAMVFIFLWQLLLLFTFIILTAVKSHHDTIKYNTTEKRVRQVDLVLTGDVEDKFEDLKKSKRCQQ